MRSGHLWPFDLHSAVVGKAIAQIQIDQTLVGYASIFGHAFEIGDHVIRQSHRHRPLELGCIRIFA